MEQIRLFDNLKKPEEKLFHWSRAESNEGLTRIPSGHTIFHEGSKPDYFFRICEGTAKVSKVTADGRQLIFGFPTIGEIIGLSGPREYSYTAEAINAVKLRPLSRAHFHKEIARNGMIAGKLLDWAFEHEEKMQAHISLLAMHHPSSRIAGFLNMAANAPSLIKNNHPIEIVLPMTQHDIATYLAVAPETYSRFMRKFRENGILKPRTGPSGKNGKKITITDIARLREIAKGEKI